MAWPEVASSARASSGEPESAARPAGSPEYGACSSLTARSFALVTTGASAILRKSRAAASGPVSAHRRREPLVQQRDDHLGHFGADPGDALGVAVGQAEHRAADHV